MDWVFTAWGGETGGLYKNWDLDDKARPCMASWHAHRPSDEPAALSAH